MTYQRAQFLRESIFQLEDYLLSDELFWALGDSFPRLTPGSLLLEFFLTDYDSTRDAGLLWAQFTPIKEKWLSAWRKKSTREMAARFRLWNEFIKEYCRDTAENQDRYVTEVRHRLILQLLIEDSGTPFADSLALEELDRLLASCTANGPCVWKQTGLKSLDPQQYWFLFVQPK